MDELSSVAADSMFNALASQSSQMSSIANQALANGIQKYMDKDYKGAAAEFKRAFGLDPFSDYAVDAARYQAMSYQRLGDTRKAIDAYKQLLKVQPDRDDIQIALGNLYFGEGMTGEAITAYEEAVRIYDDTTNRFSLGQGYLKAGRYEDAANQFEKVIRMDQSSPNGYFGLGQTFAAQKKYPQAIEQFERAIAKKKDFYSAYAEMGYTYADAGEMKKAEEVRDDLEYKDESLAALLKSYINKKTKPQILTAWGTSTFPFYSPPRTPVAGLNTYMATANASQSFTMIFQFNKEMDRESVENPINWTIKRSLGNGPGMDYNYGLPVSATEVRISPTPSDIYYDEEKFMATVRFTINQNATINATIDPSHLEFSFKGVDADGNTMNTKYDQFMGFTGSF